MPTPFTTCAPSNRRFAIWSDCLAGYTAHVEDLPTAISIANDNPPPYHRRRVIERAYNPLTGGYDSTEIYVTLCKKERTI